MSLTPLRGQSWTRAALAGQSWTRTAVPPAGQSWTRAAVPPAGQSWTRSARRGQSWTRTARLLGAALLGALAVPAVAGPAAAAPLAAGTPTARVLVTAEPGQLRLASAAVERAGGAVQRELAAVDAVVASLPARGLAARLAALVATPSVRTATPDGRVTLAADGYDPTTDAGSLTRAAVSAGVRTAKGYAATGAEVDVALLDSGVSRVPGLDAGQVVHGPDLSFDSQSDATRHVDGFGHGTHLAGIIAGREAGHEPAKAGLDDPRFLGIAPQARVVSVKVADAQGVADVTQVIAGIDWVVQHARTDGLNVRVLNLSFGTDGAQRYVVDPLAHAAEVAWRSGIVVVVSAGNTGTSLGRLTNPATDPYLIAVGAADTRGTKSVDDDAVAAFSSRGDGTRNPDLVAPGVRLASLRVPGSTLDRRHPAAVVGERYFRGSGTSQAAAVVSGVAANLLSKHPELTPDEVKAVLTGSAERLRDAPATAQGAGLVDAGAAYKKKKAGRATQRHEASTGTGTLDGARGSAVVVDAEGNALTGDRDIMGRAFDTAAMAAAASSGTAWDGGTFNGSSWAGSSWAGSSWAGSAWASDSWG